MSAASSSSRGLNARPEFRVFKRAFVALRADTRFSDTPVFAFRSHVLPYTYTATSEASCPTAPPPGHRPPDPDCRCGFYGLFDRAAISELRFSGAGQFASYASSAVLEALFFGEVEEGPHGLRASRQQILGCALSKFCQVCGSPASGVAPFVPFTDADDVEWVLCDSLCDRHLPDEGFSLAELSAGLGVDVSWGDQLPLEFARGARPLRSKILGMAFSGLTLITLPSAWAYLTFFG